MWQDVLNEKASVQINRSSYEEIRTLLQLPANFTCSVTAAAPNPTTQQVVAGSVLEEEEVSGWQIANLLGTHTIQQSAVQYSYGTDPTTLSTSVSKGKKRAPPQTDDSAAAVHIRKRAARTCKKCKSANCAGAFNGRPCAPKKSVTVSDIR